MSLLFMAGSLLLGWNVAAQTVTGNTTQFQVVEAQTDQEASDTRDLLKEIVYIESEEEVDLDFDTAIYLPKRFDPHVGDMDHVYYVVSDNVQEVDMGFDVVEYLPKGFDPYVGDLSAIDFLKTLDPVILSFDTKVYLPKGFDAYLGNYNDLAFVEEEENMDLGFDTAQYLPEKFDPHVGDLDKILFLELDPFFLEDCKCHKEMVEVVF